VDDLSDFMERLAGMFQGMQSTLKTTDDRQLTLDLPEGRANGPRKLATVCDEVIRRLEISGGDAGLRSISTNMNRPQHAGGGESS
jgi:hypothetical protein